MSDLHELLRDRVAGEHIDLTALSAAARRQGRSIRRARRAGAGLAAAAVVAAVVGAGFGAAALAGQDHAGGGDYAVATASASGSASTSALATPPLHDGLVLHLPSGATAHVMDVRGTGLVGPSRGLGGMIPSKKSMFFLVTLSPGAPMSEGRALHDAYPHATVCIASKASAPSSNVR